MPFFDMTYLLLRSRSKVGVKFTDWGQGHGFRSTFWCAAVNIRGSALPHAAKTKEESLVCVSVIRGVV